MKISEYSIRNYQFTLIMVLMVVAVGVATIFQMPRSEDPELNGPIFPVGVIYPGTSPKDMEELVVKPLEKQIYGLDDIKRIKTSINDGLAVLAVEYQYNVNVDDKYQELVREVNGLRGELPEDIYSIETKRIDPSNVNILQIALVSENASRDKLRHVAEDLQDELEKVTSLKNVEVQGIPDPIIRVDVVPSRLASWQIPLTSVASALQSELANIPGGSIQQGSKSFNVKTNGNYQNLEEIRQTIVASNNGRNVLLRDVAEVYADYSPETHITRLNGHRAAFVIAALKKGQNISAVQQEY